MENLLDIVNRIDDVDVLRSLIRVARKRVTVIDRVAEKKEKRESWKRRWGGLREGHTLRCKIGFSVGRMSLRAPVDVRNDCEFKDGEIVKIYHVQNRKRCVWVIKENNRWKKTRSRPAVFFLSQRDLDAHFQEA